MQLLRKRCTVLSQSKPPPPSAEEEEEADKHARVSKDRVGEVCSGAQKSRVEISSNTSTTDWSWLRQIYDEFIASKKKPDTTRMKTTTTKNYFPLKNYKRTTTVTSRHAEL